MSARDERRPLPAMAAVLELARAAFVRTARGRTLWVVAGIAALPSLLALAVSQAGRGLDDGSWYRVLPACMFVLIVVPAVLVASAIADEIEDKTSAYLWSRALPRWTLIIGKLLVLAPLCALLLGGSAFLAYIAGGFNAVMTPGQILSSVLGLAGAGAAAATIAALIATLIPRHAMAVTVGWMLLVDSTLGFLDIGLRHLSTTFGALAIAGYAPHAGEAAGTITLVALAAVATAVACWRIERTEA